MGNEAKPDAWEAPEGDPRPAGDIEPGYEGLDEESGARDGGPKYGVPAELSRLFEEALRCLRSTDLRGANTALQKAHAEVDLSAKMLEARHGVRTKE